jgi:hypothetical protein
MHHVARLQIPGLGLLAEPDARRGAGGDDVARQQLHELRDIGDDLLDGEDHRRGAAVLLALAIDVEPHRQRLRIADLVGGHQPGADRAEGREALALVPGRAALGLPGALGDVVDHGIAGDMRQRIGFVETLCASVPITTPSSTSQSVFSEPLGTVTGSFGPWRQLTHLLNTTGSLGIGRFDSAA